MSPHRSSLDIISYKNHYDEQRGNSRQSERKGGKTPVGGALCDSNSLDVPYSNNGKIITSKEDKFSFREMAKNLLFVNEQGEDIKVSGHDVAQKQLPLHHQTQIQTQGQHGKGQYQSQVPVEQFNSKKGTNVLKSNKSIVNDQSTTNVRYVERKQDYKIVAITNIPKKISICTLLSQIHGGPVERIEIVRNDNYQFYNDDKLYELNQPINWKEVAIFLHFSKFEDAKNFYVYSKTGIFRVNDVYLQTVLIPDIGRTNSNFKNIDIMVSKLMIGEEKARRVLVFKKPIYDKKHKTVKKRPGYPDPTINYSEEFDVEEIKRDFEEYGKLIEILPVVSRKLCFGVQYYDVRSAIKVKHVLNTLNLEDSITSGEYIEEFDKLTDEDKVFRKKYTGWYVWYGKDPCDKSVPC